MDWWRVLVSDVLVTFNIAVGLGTDGIMLRLAINRPVWTSQTRCFPSTPPAVSSTNSLWRLTDHSGAWVTRIGDKVGTVMVDTTMTIWMIGLLDKTLTRSLTLMVVSNPASPPMIVQTVCPVNIKTSSTATPQVSLHSLRNKTLLFLFLFKDSASTRSWCVTVIPIQAVVVMTKPLFIVWRNISRKMLSRIMRP